MPESTASHRSQGTRNHDCCARPSSVASPVCNAVRRRIPGMDDGTIEVIASIDALLEAVQTLRDQTNAAELLLRRAVALLHEGNGIEGTLARLPALETRAATDAAVAGVYEARHLLREAVIAAGLTEGMSTARIAEAYGVPLEDVKRHENTSLRRA